MKPRVVWEKTKYKGDWLEVVGMNVDLGNGKIVEWEAVKTKDAVATVALDDKNNVYLGKEYKVVHKDYVYTIASGFAENGNSKKNLENEARKELREELGISAKKFEKLATVIGAGRSSGKWHIYLARNVFDVPIEKEEGEFIERVKIPVNKALNLLLSNKCHFSALLGVLLAKEKLKL